MRREKAPSFPAFIYSAFKQNTDRVIGSIPEEELGEKDAGFFLSFSYACDMLNTIFFSIIFHFRNEQKTGRNYFEQLPVSFYLNYRKVSAWSVR